MTEATNYNQFLKDLYSLQDLEIIEHPSEKKRFSRDFFNYSPVLFEKLHQCCADVVLRPKSIKAISLIAEACYKYEIPLTLRGSGTGNYGQCVPIEGGAVMLMDSFKKIREFDPLTGQVTVEPGCLLGNLDSYLANEGRQLRLIPSTWRNASVGGFISGGSGGIGSVRWGFLRDPGHLKELEILTVEEKPRLLKLDEISSEPINHAYGTNGIITALTLATAPFEEWHEITIDCDDFSQAIALIKSCSSAAINIYLCSLLERRIIENIPNWSGDITGKHRILILVSADGINTLRKITSNYNVIFNNLGKEKSSNGLRELTWNHTTLHMRAKDSNWTYLQMLLPQPELDAIDFINNKWGDNILWHLESVRQQGEQRIAALPLVRWKDKEALDNLISDFKKIGAFIFNPHVITVEDGGLGTVDIEQVKAKRNFDPKGLLNPRKLKGWI